MQLVAYGVQDVFLTGSAQITFFKSVYRRHTNFAVETDTIPLDNAKPGAKSSTLILRNGDLCTKMFLHYELPEITAGMIGIGCTEICYTRRLGHAMIGDIDLSVGGTRIDRHYGQYLDIWYELSHDINKEKGYEALIGDVPELTKIRSVPQTLAEAGTVVLPSYHLYIPLQFWFNRNNGLALPLIALQFHEVKIDVSLNSLANYFVWAGTTSPALSQFQFRTSELMIDYVFLDADERRRFAQSAHEYLIEQVQNPSTESLPGSSSSTTSNYRGKPVFAHPTKELIWCLRVGAFSGGSNVGSYANSRTFLYYNHTNDSDYATSTAIDNAVKGIAECCIRDVTGGGTPGNNQHAIVYETRPLEFNLNDGKTIFTITIDTSAIPGDSNNPLPTAPTTGSNPVAGTTIAFLQLSNILGQDSGFDFLQKIKQADIIVSIDNAAGGGYVITNVLCTMIEHTVTLTDLSVPLDQLPVDNRQMSPQRSWHAREYNVVSCCNYGLDLAGNGNPFFQGNIQLNGKDRFDPQYGPYFNYIQTMAHTRTPCNGINVYSFALYPEQHQPSGTCNLSRIDTVQFNFQIRDVLRSNSNNYSGPKFDFVTDTNVLIYARNYNVFRVMAGLGGIAYSN